jgi:hypothetical protein
MKMSSPRNDCRREYVTAKAGITPVSFCEGDFSMKILLTAAALLAMSFSPTSAKMMACTGANIGASLTTVGGMPDGPKKMGMNKELAMANADMSNGKMGSACKHYAKAQMVK